MANLNADTIEEDAADLQFPKDWTSSGKHSKKPEMSVEREEIVTLDSNCFTCECAVTEPYVRCAICQSVILCAKCFANGEEKFHHKNNHDYMIVKNDFPLIKGSGWIAKEERSLLHLIQECSFGNWEDISNRLPEKSIEDCKNHYIQNYVDCQRLLGLPRIKETLTSNFGHEPIPFIFKLENIEDPPRFTPGTINYKLMAGYNAARSDFEVNYDNHAELEISKLKYNSFLPEDVHYDLAQSLQIGIFEAYNTRLKERVRRRKIIRNHGLISTRKTRSCLLRHDDTITRSIAERMRLFSQVINATEFDCIMESLHKIGELKKNLKQLLLYRQNGLKYFHSIPLFNDLLKLRQEYDLKRKQLVTITECNWQKINPVVPEKYISPVTNIGKRKIAPPLDIHPGMKEYDKLEQIERDLCSVVRILPEIFIEIKQLLMSENKKFGSVKLAQARQLLKIDVNKTKKIYEFLAKNNHIQIN